MRNFDRRLKTIEKKVVPRRQVRLLAPVVYLHSGRSITPEDEERLGPPEVWITCQQQLQAQEKANAEHRKEHPGSLGAPIIIEMDVDKEYQARQGVQAND